MNFLICATHNTYICQFSYIQNIKPRFLWKRYQNIKNAQKIASTTKGEIKNTVDNLDFMRSHLFTKQ